MNYSELLQLAKGWGNFVSDRINIWRLLLVYGNPNSGNVETDIPVVGNRLNSAWVIVPCIDVICPALAA